MKQTISNIRSAYNDTRRFANSSSNNGLVEFTQAVRDISYLFYDDISILPKKDIYTFIQNKMNKYTWKGYHFEIPLPTVTQL